MITVIASAGTSLKLAEMSSFETQNVARNVEPDSIQAATQQFLNALPTNPKTQASIIEGREIATIVASLGLPAELLSAAAIYPLVRDDIVTINTIDNSELSELSRIILELVQLGRFSLPRDWRPGEVLAVKQSDALRKMLLAVVADVRLVLVRIAEQLYRLRRAKNSPKIEQTAIAIETREIYAALASRLGVWQLKWELEDLAFRYLDPDTYQSIEIGRAHV